ncbi:Ankyrin repeat and BTB/POZ domain-containing protein 2 [Parelaphostrongylus tenuis]|uniref:Ankyrin repeat and BTB/POZ domain-containing protein 2 n=1 Tax=Parelaphostrongylus tenuis TaxID=148309 RepID=A0AAD5RB66_PARTN|nr:Ankyrin repeat and BTB/POZ domain-containing protein 2 [Parelaphostrongylus tenuis]
MLHWLRNKLHEKASESVPLYSTTIFEQAGEEMVHPLCLPDRNNVIHQKFNEITSNHKSLMSCLASMFKQKEIDSTLALSPVHLLQSINECRADDIEQENAFLLSSKRKQRNLIRMSSSGLQCLGYYIVTKQSSKCKRVPIGSWMQIMFACAEHRMSNTVNDAEPAIFQELSLISEAVLRSDTEALRSLIEVGFALNVPVPNSGNDQKSPLLSEYAGWTPLTW